MLILFVTLAQTTQPGRAPAPSMMDYLPMFALIGLVFYFILIRPQSKERKKREEMLKTVKKNDRVVTVGGVMGTVQSVREDEVTLKVDESSNTKITFTRSAIQRIVSSGPAESNGAK
jgi:preprotein translocase subunit YajC